MQGRQRTQVARAHNPARQLRADAAANRERVLAAAVSAMLRDGRSVPMAAIAEEANVGVATLYRSYPNREALLEALQLRSLRLVADLLTEINEGGKAGWDSIKEFLYRTVEHGNQLVLPYHGAPVSTSVEAADLQKMLASQMVKLLRRGRQDGTIRQGLSPRDVVIFGALIAQPLPAVNDWPGTAARQIELFMAAVAPSV